MSDPLPISTGAGATGPSNPTSPTGATSPTEFCSSCGNFVDELDELTGWCLECVNAAPSSQGRTGGSKLTSTDDPNLQGSPVPIGQARYTITPDRSGTSDPIETSKMEIALRANAERVEFYVSSANTSVWAALRLAQQDGPTCIVCGNPMPHASRGALICRKTKECRRISRRYIYLYRERGLSKIEAIAKIMGELTT